MAKKRSGAKTSTAILDEQIATKLV